jgi:hypothetical protein
VPVAVSTEYYYLRVDADHDISGDVVKFSLTKTAWPVTGTFVAVGSLPARPAAVHAANPAAAGLTGYWFRILTGPGLTTTGLALTVPSTRIYAQITDSPEVPVMHWTVAPTD